MCQGPCVRVRVRVCMALFKARTKEEQGQETLECSKVCIGTKDEAGDRQRKTRTRSSLTPHTQLLLEGVEFGDAGREHVLLFPGRTLLYRLKHDVRFEALLLDLTGELLVLRLELLAVSAPPRQ